MPMASSATKAAVDRSVFIGRNLLCLARPAASRIRPQRRRCTGRRGAWAPSAWGLAGGMFLAASRTRACAVRRSPAIAMRLPHVLLGLLALVAFPAGSAGGDALARCERSILGGSDAYFARRGAALARCVAKAARCPAAFASQATADDPCLAAVA